MGALVKRYWLFLVLLALNVLVLAVSAEIGHQSFKITWANAAEMLTVIPPIFIMLGLLDVWVERETMIRLMGEKSGVIGVLLAFALGSAAAGPLYAAFPIAGVLLKKGSKFSNVLIFIGAWSTTKVPMLLFEATSMGWTFMITRFLINIPGILLIAAMTERFISHEERQVIRENAMGMK